LAGDLLQVGLKVRGFESQRGGSSEAIRRVFVCQPEPAACDIMKSMRATRIHTTARAPQKDHQRDFLHFIVYVKHISVSNF
jgi:hypothetical protein